MRHAIVKLPLPGPVVRIEEHPQGYVATATEELAVASKTANAKDIYDGKTFAPPAAPVAAAPTKSELLAYANSTQERVLAAIWSVDVGTANASLVCTTRLDTRGRQAMDSLAIWAMSAPPGATEPYSNVDNTASTLTPAQGQTLYARTRAVFSGSTATLNNIAAAIATGSTTTFAQIDAASWPTTA